MKQKIGIWGFGKEGKSLYRFLKSEGLDENLTILLDDLDNQTPKEISTLYGLKALQAIKSGYFDLIYKSPGVSLYRSEIKEAQANGTKFSSATNLWFEKNELTKKIVITATKGKSTTASLLYHVMSKAGTSVALGGNVGKPLLDVDKKKYTIIELSSYQLADLEHAPDIFIILNLFPEHLQWHLTHDNYYNDKLRPLKYNSIKVIVANSKNLTLLEKLESCEANIKWFGKTKRPYVTTKLNGDHNQENIDAVLTVCETLGISLSDTLQHIESFEPLPHRLQEFLSKDGVLCVNDSISTTPESTMAALQVYKGQEIILLLGGTDRGQSYSELLSSIKNHSIQAIILLPKNGKRLAKELLEAGVQCPVVEVETLDIACRWIKREAAKGAVILLSPAAPSYDQFKSFEERGLAFQKLMTE